MGGLASAPHHRDGHEVNFLILPAFWLGGESGSDTGPEWTGPWRSRSLQNAGEILNAQDIEWSNQRQPSDDLGE
jgi:hypothetical protein